MLILIIRLTDHLFAGHTASRFVACSANFDPAG